jgi:GATA-binding protein
MTNFDRPSIFELFDSAQKLLPLESRLENRQTRKNNFAPNTMTTTKATGTATTAVTSSTAVSDMSVLDLLSPLSIDDMKNSPGFKQNPIKAKPSLNTPSSMHSSPPGNKDNTNVGKDRAEDPGRFDVSRRTSSSFNGYRQTSAKNSNSNFDPNWDTDDHDMNEFIKFENHNNFPLLSTAQGSDNNQNEEKLSSLFNKFDFLPVKLQTSNLSNNMDRDNMNQELLINSKTPLSTLASSLSFTTSTIAQPAKKPTECTNCHTLNTPLWRKDPSGNTLCNACGLFLKLHGSTRPLSLKTDVIRKRARRQSSSKTSANISMPLKELASKSSVLSGIPIQSTSVPNKVLSSSIASTPLSLSNNQNGRFKNVLILPKPPSQPTTPGATASSSLNMKSIQIPSKSIDSISSPIGTPNPNQQFKRKKSELNLVGTSVDTLHNDNYNNYNSGNVSPNDFVDFNRRVSTSSTLSNSYKRNFQMGQKLSSSNLLRKNSNAMTPNAKSVPISNLTTSNINLLCQRNNSYFDDPTVLSRKNSSTIILNINTPGSMTSISSLGVDINRNNSLLNGITPSSVNSIPTTPYNVTDLLPSSRPSNINPPSNRQFFHDDSGFNGEVMDVDFNSPGEIKEDDELTFKATRSELTRGLQNQKNIMENGNNLDWLKFEI